MRLLAANTGREIFVTGSDPLLAGAANELMNGT
jgi:hypothetical protein